MICTHVCILSSKQVELITELEDRLPFVRLYFFKKFYLLKKHDGISPLRLLQATFDDKVKAVKDSKENNSSVIEDYQVTSQLTSYSIISNVNVLI